MYHWCYFLVNMEIIALLIRYPGITLTDLIMAPIAMLLFNNGSHSHACFYAYVLHFYSSLPPKTVVLHPPKWQYPTCGAPLTRLQSHRRPLWRACSSSCSPGLSGKGLSSSSMPGYPSWPRWLWV